MPPTFSSRLTQRLSSSSFLSTSTSHRRLNHHHRFFPASFIRGGTSNGLIIHASSLPPKSQWHTILPSAMGSPDPYARQLNGMGSGTSSTSKIMVLSPPSRPDVDVDYTFVQVGIQDGSLEFAGNCGNLSAAIGPVAWDWGLVRPQKKAIIVQPQEQQTLNPGDQHLWASVRTFNTNTQKVMVSRFRVSGDPETGYHYCPDGDYALDGVPGTNSTITMSFIDPAGSKTGKALPTGNPVDIIHLSEGTKVTASLVDASNPGIFVPVSSLNIAPSPSSSLTPAQVQNNPQLMAQLAEIRRKGAEMMGLDPNIESVPKVVMVFSPSPEEKKDNEVDIACLALSMGLAHRAVPLTLALCLGAACGMEGTVASDLVGVSRRGEGESVKRIVRIGHPSGRLDVGTTFEKGKLVSAELLSTMRVLMKGDVYY